MRRGILKIIVVLFILLLNAKSIPCQAASKVTVSTFSDLRKYLGDEKEYTITIGANIEITDKLTVTGVKSIIGNGKCLYRGTSYTSSYLFVIKERASLNLASNLYVSGNSGSIKNPAKPLIRVGARSVLKLGDKVNLYNNYSDSGGGAIYCEGTIYIQGANIYNCQCNTCGGAIQLAQNSKCYMSAGRIYNNKASTTGGAIRQYENSEFTISGGSIDSNTSITGGYGMHLYGTLILTGEGQISKNNDIFIASGGLVQTGNWTKPYATTLTTTPEVGKKIVSAGKKYKSYFVWSARQEMATDRPICIVNEDLVVGAYYPIHYYSDSAKKKLYTSQKKLYGSTITLLDKGPSVQGYSFKGWYSKSVDGANMTGVVYGTNAELSLFSRYAANNYQVSYLSQNTVIRKDIVIYNGKYGSQPVTSMDGYVFKGWYLDQNCTKLVTSSTVVTTAADHTLYAGWAPLNCQVFFDATGGEIDIKQKEVVYNGNYGVLPQPKRTGYEFIGWYTLSKDGSICNENTLVTVSSEHTLYARWKPCVYRVTWDPAGGKASFAFSDVTYGGSYNTMPNVTKDGYRFDGWYTQLTGGTKCSKTTIVSTASAHILYARWIKILPPAITIRKISITGLRNYYKENQSIHTKGLKLMIEYSNNSKKTVYSGWTIDGYKKSAGQRNVVFRYQGKSCTVKCTWLTAKSIAKIVPKKKSYTGYVGEKPSISFSSYKGLLQLTYKSSNSKIVKVSKTGKMELKKAGTAYVSVGIRLGNIVKTVKIKVVVKKPKLVAGYTYGEKWNQLLFKAYVTGSSKKPAYSSSKSKIAKIDKKTGKLYALKTGKVTITIKVGSFQKKYKLTINKSKRCILID